MYDAIRAFTWNTITDKWTQGLCVVLVIALSVYNGVYRIDWTLGIIDGGWHLITEFGLVVPFSLVASALLVWIVRIIVVIIRGIWFMSMQWLEDKMGVAALRERHNRLKSEREHILAARQQEIEEARREGYEEGYSEGLKQSRGPNRNP